LFGTVQNYAADLEIRVADRTKELESEHQRLETLLNIITELSGSLDLDLVLSRTLSVINEAIGAQHSNIMLIRVEETSLYMRSSLGYATPPPTRETGPQTGGWKSLLPGRGLMARH